MTNLAMNNLFLISGIVFLTIAVVGQSKLLFIEINPGCFGRLLALIIAIVSLSLAFPAVFLSMPNFDIFRNWLQNFIPEFQNMINQFQLFD